MLKINNLFLFVMLLTPGYFFGQNKKEIKKYKIKSLTEFVTDNLSDKPQKTKMFSRFDNSGNLTEYIEFDVDGTISKRETYLLNKSGDVLEHSFYKANGSVQKKISRKFNSNNDKTEEIVTDSQGNQIEKRIISYDVNGNKTLEMLFDFNNKLAEKTVLIYNKYGMKIEKNTYKGNGVLISQKNYQYAF